MENDVKLKNEINKDIMAIWRLFLLSNINDNSNSTEKFIQYKENISEKYKTFLEEYTKYIIESINRKKQNAFTTVMTLEDYEIYNNFKEQWGTANDKTNEYLINELDKNKDSEIIKYMYELYQRYIEENARSIK